MGSTLFCSCCFETIEWCACDDWCTCSAPCSPLEKQSAEIIIDNEKSDEVVSTQETTTFADENLGLKVGNPTPYDPLNVSDTVITANLAEFLSRPVRISSFTWNESSAAGTTLNNLNPWTLFFNNPAIMNKIANFAFIRCDLKIKILINASPFYYGCLAMAYQPLPTFTPTTINLTTANQYLIPFSQRPIMWIYAQGSQGGEMNLPFFYHKNWLRLGVAQDFNTMGTLRFINYTTLQSANGVTGTGVTVQVYAWAENVVLSGSTTQLTLQSKIGSDEYGQGMISKPATAVANLASMARDVPVLGKYATATEIGARAVSGIASLFGFTNVPVIEDTKPLRPQPFPQMATAEIGYPVEKLTLDPKNELALDPTIVGAPSNDELAIDSLVQRESFILSTNWATTQAVDTILFSSRVTPFMFSASGNTSNSVLDFTPMAMVANLFYGWRGDIIFRFKIIASPYHKGRLVISYDPQGNATNILNTAATTSTVYTQIIDLGDNDDVEVRVPYQQALPFLQTNLSFDPTNIPFSNSTSPSFTTVDGTDNGTISVRVQTTLTAPVLTAPVTVLVFCRGADNMEFANPVAPGATVTNYVVQSKTVSEEEQTRLVSGSSGSMIETERYRVNYGECVRSLRTLFRRTVYVGTQQMLGNGTVGLQSLSFTFGKLPPYLGFDPNGIHTASAIVGSGTKNYNFVQNNPINWILPCFIGYRGSGIWTFNDVYKTAVTTISVTRDPTTPMQMQELGASGLYTPATRSGAAATLTTNRRNTSSGCALTNQYTNAGLSVLCPNYNNYKMNSTTPGNTTLAPTTGQAYDGSDKDSFVLQTVGYIDNFTAANILIEKYWGCGTDFQPLFFLNCPSLYRQPTLPTPV